MADLTVVLTHYRRKENILRILDSLVDQTHRPQIFVWDNSPELGLEHPGIDWLVRSSVNTECSSRWWMATQATTRFAVIHDDDLLPLDDEIIADTVAAAERTFPYVVGNAGVVLDETRNPADSLHVGPWSQICPIDDMPVDLIKGCYFCAPVAKIREVGWVLSGRGDDALMSLRLGDGRTMPHRVIGGLGLRFQTLEQGPYALWKQPHFHATRKKVLDNWFKDA